MREEKWAKNCSVKNLMVNLLSLSEKVLGFSGMRRGAVPRLSLAPGHPPPGLSLCQRLQPSPVPQVRASAFRWQRECRQREGPHPHPGLQDPSFECPLSLPRLPGG